MGNGQDRDYRPIVNVESASIKLPQAAACVALAVAFGVWSGAAQAGETACRIENGVVLAPARVAGIDGEFIFDTASAGTILDATRASAADITGDIVTGPVTVAGLTRPSVTIQVAELDPRTRDFPTPIAGVLGSDVLGGLVVDIQAEPCRLGLYQPGAEPPVEERKLIPLQLTSGVPYLRASASDGRKAVQGDFALSLGSDRAVRLSPGRATFAARRPDATAALDALAPSDRALLRASLTTLLVGGVAFREASAGLLDTAPPPDTLGVIGEPVWMRFRMRIDYPRLRLMLSPP